MISRENMGFLKKPTTTKFTIYRDIIDLHGVLAEIPMSMTTFFDPEHLENGFELHGFSC